MPPMRRSLGAWMIAVVLGGCGTSPTAPADAGTAAIDDLPEPVWKPKARDAGVDDAPEVDAGPPVPCTVTPPTACPEPAPTYADVAPILEARCVLCHSGIPEGPWPLTSYPHVADWKNEIRAEVSKCTMPPPAAKVAITDAERETILAWILCGMPH